MDTWCVKKREKVAYRPMVSLRSESDTGVSMRVVPRGVLDLGLDCPARRQAIPPTSECVSLIAPLVVLFEEDGLAVAFG